jgi:predicted nucleic acid-binding Zn ribbon protein
MSFSEPPPGDVRRCIKCGREIGPDQSMCAVCNRAGMATPSATQYHGTIVVAVIGAVAALAVGASLSLRGVGPYEAEVIRIAAADPGYDITVRVRNAGSREGRAHCQLVAISETGRRLQTRTTLTPPVAAGAAVTVTEHLAGLTERPEDVTVGCG